MSVSPMITIIDDDEFVRLATESFMRSLGFETRTFACAEDFFSSPLRHATDCIITDVQMPGMSGVELLARLRAEGSAVPVIVVTAFPSDRIRSRATELGALGFFPKPFSGADIVACIEKAVGPGPAGP
ncbi:response regulator receiver [Azorhizobium caulinodans ORS 571]|uniref:Response regulator receiver n=2 Tax=Azorhizobium caulinodans TaxID=7 RepID=A8I5H9_AZOC5|nr:response regulator [Azorhizobium caulinodans]BAF88280.1 response regulator receiver [Azorhizobium caulinodans ORS 571]